MAEPMEPETQQEREEMVAIFQAVFATVAMHALLTGPLMDDPERLNTDYVSKSAFAIADKMTERLIQTLEGE